MARVRLSLVVSAAFCRAAFDRAGPPLRGQRSKQADPPRGKSEAIAKQVTLKNRVDEKKVRERWGDVGLVKKMYASG